MGKKDQTLQTFCLRDPDCFVVGHLIRRLKVLDVVTEDVRVAGGTRREGKSLGEVT